MKLIKMQNAARVAAHLQRIENNPLDGDDVAMFKMFENKGWSQDQRRAYILEQTKSSELVPAAE